eukprot:TRINITY_DN12398_c0_g1_i1.p2 TRINITY_DN12398_c0_g1~~TRINITY_DN12398_c0_g1_i1.p2  ORF type:complete len:316 (+),score=65.23 TRINITY_DN12398_c0_g1_i1:73-948(+)
MKPPSAVGSPEPSELRSMYDSDFVPHPYVAHRVPRERARPQQPFTWTTTSRATYRGDGGAFGFQPKGRCDLTPGSTLSGMPFYPGGSEQRSRFTAPSPVSHKAPAPMPRRAEAERVLGQSPAARTVAALAGPRASPGPSGKGGDGLGSAWVPPAAAPRKLPPLPPRSFCGTTTASASFVAHEAGVMRACRGNPDNAHRRAKQRTHGQGLGLSGGTSRYREDYEEAAAAAATVAAAAPASPRALRKPQLPTCYAAPRWGGGYRSAPRPAQGVCRPSVGKGVPWGPSAIYRRL